MQNRHRKQTNTTHQHNHETKTAKQPKTPTSIPIKQQAHFNNTSYHKATSLNRKRQHKAKIKITKNTIHEKRNQKLIWKTATEIKP